MAAPICVQHACEMVVEKNGAVAVETYRPGTDQDVPYAAWAYDQWACPVGGERILSGRATEAIAREGDAAMDRYLSGDALMLLSREQIRDARREQLIDAALTRAGAI